MSQTEKLIGQQSEYFRAWREASSSVLFPYPYKDLHDLIMNEEIWSIELIVEAAIRDTHELHQRSLV